MVQIKRVYDEPGSDDGFRVLVDRLWPRGLRKENAVLDVWMKEIAPSPELRKWFGHDPDRFAEFSALYNKELADNPAINELQDIIKQHKTVTLLYAAHDPNINHALVLKNYLGRT
jgi:uncharacterized protein YeaO (DUF488 family)